MVKNEIIEKLDELSREIRIRKAGEPVRVDSELNVLRDQLKRLIKIIIDSTR